MQIQIVEKFDQLGYMLKEDNKEEDHTFAKSQCGNGQTMN